MNHDQKRDERSRAPRANGPNASGKIGRIVLEMAWVARS